MTMMMMMLQISSLLQHVDFGDSDAMIVVYTGERSDVVGERRHYDVTRSHDLRSRRPICDAGLPVPCAGVQPVRQPGCLEEDTA